MTGLGHLQIFGEPGKVHQLRQAGSIGSSSRLIRRMAVLVVEMPFIDCRYAFYIDLSTSGAAGGGECDACHSQEVAW